MQKSKNFNIVRFVDPEPDLRFAPQQPHLMKPLKWEGEVCI